MLRTFRLIDAAALSSVALLVAACTDSGAPTGPTGQLQTEMITCQAAVRAGTLTCVASQSVAAPQLHAAPGMSFNRIVGGQGALVRLASSATSYNSGTQVFSSSVTLENLLSQAMNTADGTTPDAGGIKVFFHSGPTVTGGSGIVDVANPDGVDLFTGTNQPFFLYSSGAVLSSGGSTSPKTWQFDVSTTVTTFAFQVFVTTRLPDEISPLVALGLSRTPSALTILPGASGTTTVNLTRTNFAGAVTLSLSGAPSGVTGSFSPAAPTGTSSTLTLNVGGNVATGVYTLTVTGTGTGIGGTRSTRLTLTVGTAGVGNVTVDFSSCPVADRAVWLAAQDGGGAWTRIPGGGDVYTFTIGSSGGGLAYVTLGASDAASVTVQYMTQAEFTAGGTRAFCPPPPVGKTVNGSVAGVAVTDQATVSLGYSSATVSGFGSLAFQLTQVPDGAQDLVAYRHSSVGGPESAIIRRNQNIPDNGTITTLDFDGVEAFTPATATMTLNGLLGGEQVFRSMGYQVANCATASLYGDMGGATFTAFGIPSGQQQPTDLHDLNVLAYTSTEFRSIQQFNHSLVARTLTLGAVLPSPTITTLATPPAYQRLQAVYTLPADYQGQTTWQYYNDPVTKVVDIIATFGYLGGPSTTLALPDFSALSGWDNNWAPASAGVAHWSVSAGGFSGSPCTEGATGKSAQVSGTF